MEGRRSPFLGKKEHYFLFFLIERINYENTIERIVHDVMTAIIESDYLILRLSAYWSINELTHSLISVKSRPMSAINMQK